MKIRFRRTSFYYLILVFGIMGKMPYSYITALLYHTASAMWTEIILIPMGFTYMHQHTVF